MTEHFIKNIEIKNFKCFEDFKAEGFGRVNLIGGKNNVGKTAFMESCYIGSKILSKEYISFDNIDNHTIDKELSNVFNILAFHRSPIDFLLHNKFEFPHYIVNSSFIINGTNYLYDDYFTYMQSKDEDFIMNNSTFISTIDIVNEKLVNNIFEIKLLNKEDELNGFLKELFDIEKVDVIRNEVMFKQKDHYMSLSSFGDGMKYFLSIVLTLYLNNDSRIYLDEIENGIHYSNLDKLWEIILTISKEQNVQVFATTHSKECIESYARVAKKLGDEEVTYSILSKLKSGNIHHSLYDYTLLETALYQEHEVR